MDLAQEVMGYGFPPEVYSSVTDPSLIGFIKTKSKKKKTQNKKPKSLLMYSTQLST